MKGIVRPNDSSNKLSKDNILKRDIFGRTILHLAVITDDPETLRKGLRASDTSSQILVSDYENGWNVLHHIFYHKRVRCFRVLMECLENSAPGSGGNYLLQELLKAKDRNGIPPISLLVTDYKDFAWNPCFLSQNNIYTLEPRFKSEHDSFRPYPRQVRDDWFNISRGGSDIYVMGSNSNATLGLGDSDDRSFPTKLAQRDFKLPHHDLLSFLQQTRFSDVQLRKYHSTLVTAEGAVFSCGLGSSGRLGHGSAANTFKYTQVELADYDESTFVKHIAVSNGHTVAHTSSDRIFSWGQNHYNQLGFTTVEENSFKKSKSGPYENSPCRVDTGVLKSRSREPLKGLVVSEIHSMAYSKNSIIAWGLNIGQMGFTDHRGNIEEYRVKGATYKGSIVKAPTEIPFHENIKILSTCETCTCVVTESSDIFVFTLLQRVKLQRPPSRSYSEALFDCFKPSSLTVASTVRKVVLRSQENIFLLLDGGDILSFCMPQDANPRSSKNIKYNRVWKAYSSDMRAVDMDATADGSLIVCTRNGTVFVKAGISTSSQRRASGTSTMPTFLMSSKNKFRKVDGINKVARVCCDDSFSSFSFIRDDIDMILLNLEHNDFIRDMSYFSTLYQPDTFRKQNQLLHQTFNEKGVTTDFVYLTSKGHNDDDFSQKYVETSSFDQLSLSRVESKGPGMNYRMVQTLKSDNYTEDIRNLNKRRFIAHVLPYLNAAEKLYDAKICLPGQSVEIGFHRTVFARRSPFCRQLFDTKDSKNIFEAGGLQGYWDPTTKELVFTSKIDMFALIALHYYVYSGNPDLGLAWPNLEEEHMTSPPSPEARGDYLKLLSLFRVQPERGRYGGMSTAYVLMLDDTENTDVVVSLQDGQSLCHSFIITARCAFFETVLSDRWSTSGDKDTSETKKVVELDSVNSSQFQIIKRYLYGVEDLETFDVLYDEVKHDETTDSLVNYCLDLMEVCDQLLIVHLKHLCELVIKDFINTDNVFLLLAHAYCLDAQKLFKCCCWYIFNNLETLIFDRTWVDFDDELLRLLEEQLLVLQQFKHVDANIGGSHELLKPKSVDCVVRAGGDCTKFLTNTEEFNEIFVKATETRLPFEPLFDVKKDVPNTSNERRLSRRNSRKQSVVVGTDLYNFRLNQDTKANDSVVFDDHDEEPQFEVVTRRRKSKSSESKARESKPSELNSADPNPLNGTSSVSMSETSSAIVSENDGEATSMWGSRNSSTSSLPIKAPLGPALGEFGLRDTKIKSKIKFVAPAKLSQKQRKKLVQEPSIDQQPVEGSSLKPLLNPWKTIDKGSSSKNSAVEKLPVLGKIDKEKPKQPEESLAAIMLQESIKIEEQKLKESQRKTLQEIQQEQEFAKWWEEESRRVQQELMELSGQVRNGAPKDKKSTRGSQPKNSNNTKPEKSSKPKPRRPKIWKKKNVG